MWILEAVKTRGSWAQLFERQEFQNLVVEQRGALSPRLMASNTVRKPTPRLKVAILRERRELCLPRSSEIVSVKVSCVVYIQ